MFIHVTLDSMDRNMGRGAIDQHKNYEHVRYNNVEARNDGNGSSNQRYFQDPSSKASTNMRPPDYNVAVGARPVLNYSIQTGEEFALEFMRERVNPRQHLASGDPNSAPNYMDLKGLLGISHTGSESGSDTSLPNMVDKGRVQEFERKASYAHEDKSYFDSVRLPQTSSRNDSNRGLHYASSGMSDSSVRKVKFLCSFGGKILPRPSDGRLRYVGGETRIIRLNRDIFWQDLMQKMCRLDKPFLVDEVHLRRFDGLLENGGVHRCVVASVTVKAPVREVWNVLTAYESLPEIVPNLAISRILSRENNKVRILQEGCKGLLYMVLHARVVLDLCEQLEEEISFEQVEGDFDSFRGKWVLEQLGSHHTLLKYSVESKMRKDTFLSEAIMEEVIYEDLPSNLCTIRDYVEKREAAHSSKTSDENIYTVEETASCSTGHDDERSDTTVDQISDTDAQSSSWKRPRVPGLQRDIEVLKSELLKFISEHGQEGFMPMRKQLRVHGRVDIEKAIRRMGGFRRIASLMNLSLAYKNRKPKGYWDSLDNMQEEINRFQRSWGMDPSFMPSRKSFERAGRYDIARALEKWGGLHEVSRLLSLKVRHPNRQPNLGRDVKLDYVVSTDVEEEEKVVASNPYVSQDTQKWISELKHLDFNWVE